MRVDRVRGLPVAVRAGRVAGFPVRLALDCYRFEHGGAAA
jgi:hypothetical protein